MTRAEAARTTLAIFFVAAGALHFIVPDYYLAIVPSYLSAPRALVALSGVAEIAGGVGLLIPRLRQVAGVGLMLLLVAVFPANIEMLRQARARSGPSWVEAVLWLRLPLQVLLLWLAWRVSGPFSRPRAA